MISTLRWLACLLWLVYTVGYAAAPITWSVDVAMDNQIFPSLAYSMANLRGDDMVVGKRKVRRLPQEFASVENLAKRPFVVKFSQLAPTSKASIRVKCDGVMEPTSITVDLSKNQIVYVPVAFNHDTLVKNRQSKPANVEFVVSINGAPGQKVIKTVTVRPINDCPYYFLTSKATGRGIDLSWMFTAYVNEDHPLIDEILRNALNSGIVKSFDGYQSKNIDQVRDQVRAVWTALSMMGIRYSSITASANRSDIAFSQHVRLVGESSTSNQANCVDGSVLIASVLEKIGIETDLVKVPGHMYVRFWLDPWKGEKRRYCCLETTVLGEGFPPAKSPKKQMIEAADKSYVHAWTHANTEFDKVRDKFTGDSSDYKLINVGEGRKRGIIPIPNLALAKVN